MSPHEILQVRTALHLTQGQLAQLVGVHPLTVSKWERGTSGPSPYQAGLLQAFSQAARRDEAVGRIVRDILVGAGIGLALYAILDAAFSEERTKRRRR